ncbi:MAG: branched-chain amino acid ABC transporter permease [Chloroflexi bacterium HGW-Chloroflexi-6]|nr:MAG: branched-chain amino acid ABC transporter permease [Chloroflexi bacterium HGW-Chloroflexi-6]
MQNSPSSQFVYGLRAELPILLGVAPFGMIYGILALGAGLSPLAAQAMSAVVFAGSSQFMLVQLIGMGAPALVMVLTGFVINLRHALYSASIAPHTLGLNLAWKGILSYLLTDEAYAVTVLHYNADSPAEHKHWYFFGAGLTLWTGWQISTAIGIFLGAQIPASWGLDFTLALTFIALVFPVIRDRPTLLAALAAGLTSILAAGLPYKLGLVTAALVGILTGLLAERK